MYDIIVIGGGPAGLSAALYGLRNGKKVLVVERSVFGGQICNSPKVENIPGFTAISGDEFADRFLDQVLDQGGEVMLEEATEVKNNAGIIRVKLANGQLLEGKTLIIASGARHRTLGLENEEELIGQSISFCAVCDGNLYKNKTVVMVGGGNSALVEANLLAEIVDKLIILQDKPVLTADQKLIDALYTHNNVEVHTSVKVKEYVLKEKQLSGVAYEENGEAKIVECAGVFLAVGLIPNGELFKELADLDRFGYIKADESCQGKDDNVFVAGDVRTKTLRQVTTACADGAIAAIRAVEYLNR